MIKTFVMTISACLLGTTILTSVIPDEKIKPFAKLGISFVILAVFIGAVFNIKTIDIEIPKVETKTQEYSIADIYESQVEQAIKEKYGVESKAIIEINEEKEITLKKIILYEATYMLEIKEEFKPEEIEIK